MLVVFLALKLVVIFSLAKWMGMAWQDRPMFTLLLAQGGEFGFVVFQASAGAKIFDAEVASLLIGAVALSMLLTPLLIVAFDRLLAPRFARNKAQTLAEIHEPQDAPVIVAGFGRYGQIVARLLMANGIRTTVLDHDAERIESARAFGYRVFYGDATRLDLLRLAGAAEARVIMVAVDDTEATNTIVDLVRTHFAKAQLVVRVRDLTHAFDMLDRGIQNFDREVLDASLRSSRRVLDALGTPAAEAHRMVQSFHDHNVELMHQTHRIRHDRKQLVAVAKKARADLEQQMSSDRELQAHTKAHADAAADAIAKEFRLPSV